MSVPSVILYAHIHCNRLRENLVFIRVQNHFWLSLKILHHFHYLLQFSTDILNILDWKNFHPKVQYSSYDCVNMSFSVSRSILPAAKELSTGDEEQHFFPIYNLQHLDDKFGSNHDNWSRWSKTTHTIIMIIMMMMMVGTTMLIMALIRTCGAQTAAFTKDFLDRMATPLAQGHCHDYQVVIRFWTVVDNFNTTFQY